MDVSLSYLCTEPCWSYGCKPHWFSELGVLGAHLSGGSHKSWGTRYWIQTLGFLRRRWELCIPSQLHVAVLGLDFFLIHTMCTSHLAHFWISFRGIIPFVAVDSVCPQKQWVQETSMSPSWTRQYLTVFMFLFCSYLLNLLGWHRSTKSYRFQVHNSTTHLLSAHCIV